MGWILPKSQSSQSLWVVLLCSFLLVSCFSPSPPSILCKSEEKTTLLEFKSHFSINESSDDCQGSHMLSWKDQHEDCCGWDGVTCDEATGYVIGLHLSLGCLYGNIPLNSSLFNLIHLQELNLSSNNFNNSQISPLFSNFRNLTVLSLDNSRFSGVVPNEFFQLPELLTLEMSENRRLTGELPNSIGELESLETLSLGWCNFSGSIPTSLGSLTLLTTFNITSNNFGGPVPASLSNLRNLKILDLSNNNLEGPVLHPIPNITSCSHLDLSGNSFTGTIELDMFTKLRDLEHLDLSENNFTGTIDLGMFTKLQDLEYLHLSNSGLSLTSSNSDFLSAFPSITSLGLSSCYLSANILTNLSNESELSYIDLSNNNITQELDTSICNLDSLIYLDLSQNQLDGIIPACLGNSTRSLSILNLQSNKFHGTIPQSFGYANSIQLLDLSNNLLHGSLPRSLVNCTHIEVLNLGGNMLMDGFPFWLGNLSSLKVLILRENRLYGTITGNLKKEQGHFANIHIIDMSHNLLTGTFPSRYFDSWNAMTIVDEKDASPYAYVQTKDLAVLAQAAVIGSTCSRAQYSSCIPSSNEVILNRSCRAYDKCRIGDAPAHQIYYYYYSLDIMNKGLLWPYTRVLTALKVVDFSNNKFHGSIPPSIGRLKGIIVLNLSGNALAGRVPRFLGNLINLESLDLSDNMLSGEIPADLSNLNSLGVLDFSQNDLTGLIPSFLERFPNTSFEGNPGLCGLPLSRLCSNPTEPNSHPPNFPIHKKQHFKFEINDFGWEVVLVGYGCGLVFGLGIGSLIFLKKERWVHRAFHLQVR